MKYEIKDNDNAKGDRNGGFGSTDKQKENQAFAQGLADQLAEAISNSMNTQLNNSIMGGSINGQKISQYSKILNIEPIEGADKIEKLTVLGWHVVASKSEGHKIGDLVVYIEIDTQLPELPILNF